MLGTIFASFTSSPSKAIFQIVFGAFSFILGGVIATTFIKETPTTNKEPSSFSPGALAIATIIGLSLFLVMFWVFL